MCVAVSTLINFKDVVSWSSLIIPILMVDTAREWVHNCYTLFQWRSAHYLILFQWRVTFFFTLSHKSLFHISLCLIMFDKDKRKQNIWLLLFVVQTNTFTTEFSVQIGVFVTVVRIFVTTLFTTQLTNWYTYNSAYLFNHNNVKFNNIKTHK